MVLPELRLAMANTTRNIVNRLEHKNYINFYHVVPERPKASGINLYTSSSRNITSIR